MMKPSRVLSCLGAEPCLTRAAASPSIWITSYPAPSRWILAAVLLLFALLLRAPAFAGWRECGEALRRVGPSAVIQEQLPLAEQGNVDAEAWLPFRLGHPVHGI